MRTGICPKCNLKTVYATNLRDSEFKLPTSENFIGVTVEIINSERYVCTTCGYFERYVSNRDFLNQITNSSLWIKV